MFAYKKIQRNGDAFSVGPTNLEMKNRNPLPLHGDVKRKLIFLSTDKIKKKLFFIHLSIKYYYNYSYYNKNNNINNNYNNNNNNNHYNYYYY